MTYYELLLQGKNGLDEMVERLGAESVGGVNAEAESDVLRSVLHQLSGCYAEALDSLENLNYDFHDILGVIFENALSKAEHLASVNRNERGSDLTNAVCEFLHSQTDIVKKLTDGLEAKEHFKESLQNGGEANETSTQIEEIGEGVRPTFADCIRIKVGETAPKEVFAKFLWLDRMEFMASQTGIDPMAGDESIYKSLRNRIISEINTADPSLQMEYVKLIARHYDGMKNTENPFASDFANHLIASFSGSKMGELLAASGTDIPDIAADRPISEETARSYAITLSDNAYTMSGVMGKVARVYDKVISDNNPASPTFAALKRAMDQLGRFDFDANQNDVSAQKRVIEKAIDAAQIYLNTHKSFAISDSGKNRLDAANSIIRELKPLHNDLVSMENALIRERKESTNDLKEEILSEERNRAVDPQKLIRYANANRLIGSTSIVPKQPEFYAKEGWFGRLMSTVKHGLYTGILAVATATINLAGYLFTAPWQIQGNGKKDIHAEINTKAVPGSLTGEQFEDEDIDGKPDNQEIIKDNRKFPIVYERPIPEDPNQPPTLSVEVDQALEGDTNGFPIVKDLEGERFQMGHAFISLCYTKTNPLTGKPGRYRCSFGFYPSQQANDKISMLSQGLDGLRVPGFLDDDFEHKYSVGKTFTVTNKQINKVFAAAENYDRGGYNYMKRNCANFAKEMAEVAGLDVSEFFEKRDLNTVAVAGISPLGIIAGKATSRLGMKKMLSHGDELSQDYHTYGQKLISKDDVRNLDKRKFNISLRGYIPGHIAEAMRQDSEFTLHSQKYHTNLENVMEVDEDTPIATVRIQQISVEQIALVNSISQYARGHHLDMDNAIVNMLNYFENYSNAISRYAVRALNGRKEDGKVISLAEQSKALIDGTKAINDFIKGINDIYRDSFKSLPALNLSFQHFVSNLEYLKNDFASKYNTLYSGIKAHQGKLQGISWADARLLTDNQADSAFAKRLFCVGAVKYAYPDEFNTDELTTRDYIGILKTFGSIPAYFEQKAVWVELNNAEGARTLTAEETKTKEEFEHRLEVLQLFSKTEDGLLVKEKWSEHDFRFIFERMRQSNSSINPDKTEFSAYRVMSALAFDKCIGGIKENLTGKIKEWQNGFVDELKKLAENYHDFDSPKFVVPRMKLEAEYGNKLVGILSQHVTSKLQNSNEYKMIRDILAEELMKDDKKDISKLNSKTKEYYRCEAEAQLMSDMLDYYLRPVIREINMDACYEKDYSSKTQELLTLTINDNLSSEAFRGSLQMKPFRSFVRNEKTHILKSEEEIASDCKRNYKTSIAKEQKRLSEEKTTTNCKITEKIRDKLYSKLAKKCGEGEVHNDDPQVQSLISQIIVCYAVLSSLSADNYLKGGDINPEFIQLQGEKLVKGGKYTEIISKINDPNLAHQMVADYKAQNSYAFTQAEKKLIKGFSAERGKIASDMHKIELKKGPEIFCK